MGPDVDELLTFTDREGIRRAAAEAHGIVEEACGCRKLDLTFDLRIRGRALRLDARHSASMDIGRADGGELSNPSTSG